MKMWRGREALSQLEGVRRGVLWEVKISSELDRHRLESEVAFSRGNRMCKTVEACDTMAFWGMAGVYA